MSEFTHQAENVFTLPRAVVRPATDDLPERLAALAEAYCRQTDKLAALVEAENHRTAAFHAALASQLGALHTALDELAHKARATYMGPPRAQQRL